MKAHILISSVVLTVLTSGCVVEPVRPAFVAPAGVVYVAPTYVSPGAGYAWAYHSGYGWGWYHANYGWHRGWR